jgi:hypothetical protein
MTMTLSGDGTITGLVAGGLPNATVTADDLASGAAVSNIGYTPTNQQAENINFRNRIINGDMRIAQRGTSFTISDSTATYTVDRWRIYENTDGAFTLSQDTTVPAGFTNSLKVLVTTADASVTSAQLAYVSQFIEGFNVADLGWGAAGAKTVTLSFWVRSSVTGTFGGGVINSDNNRSYPFTYAISVADTWEYKTVTIDGDTSGTWVTNSGVGLRLMFSMGSGSNFQGTAGQWNAAEDITATGETALVNTLNATWYITGVQLEVGSVATPFERRPYGTELSLCQRYYVRWNASDAFSYFTSGLCYDNTSAVVALANPVQMRAQPTWGAPSNCRLYDGTTASLVTSISVNRSSVLVSSGNFTTGSISFVQSNPVVVSANNNSAAYLEVTAEL